MSLNYLQFTRVTKAYGAIEALKGVSLRIQPGDRVALLGSNGAGKSTFMNLASGIRRHDTGEIEVFSDAAGSLVAKQKMRILPQELSFPEQLKVKEILNLVAAHYDHYDYKKVVSDMQLEYLLSRRTDQLSGGEHKRVGIVATLIGKPDLVLLDEPTSNIDLQGRRLVYQVLEDYLSNKQKALVFSSHQMQDVEHLADKVVVLKQGVVVATGTKEEIKSQYGLKKVCFRSKNQDLAISSAKGMSREGETVTLLGQDSDQMIRELIARDASANSISISDSSLDEIFIQIWNEKA